MKTDGFLFAHMLPNQLSVEQLRGLGQKDSVSYFYTTHLQSNPNPKSFICLYEVDTVNCRNWMDRNDEAKLLSAQKEATTLEGRTQLKFGTNLKARMLMSRRKRETTEVEDKGASGPNFESEMNII